MQLKNIEGKIISDSIDLFISNLSCRDEKGKNEMEKNISLYMNDYVYHCIDNLEEKINFTQEDINDFIEKAIKTYCNL